METTNKFKYKIREFDRESLNLTVDFEDGRWARITLIEPLPSTPAGLETIISRYTEPMEYKAALVDTTTDLSYISSMVGKEREATRMWLKPPEQPAPRPLDPDTGKTVEELIGEIIGPEATENQVVLYSNLSQLKERYSKISYLMMPEMMNALTTGCAEMLKQWSKQAIQQMKEYQQAILDDSVYNPPELDDVFVEFKKPGEQ